MSPRIPRPEGGEHVIEVVVAALWVVLFHENRDSGTRPQETGGNPTLVGRLAELIAGDLFPDELVIRLVVVERLDDVVSIAPRVGTVAVVLEAARVCIARDIEPVAPPPLAVVRRGEQPIDEPLPGTARRVVEERVRLLEGGRKANQIEIRAAQKRPALGPGSGADALVPSLLLEETVDRVVRAELRKDGDLGRGRKPERPVLACVRRQRGVFERGERIGGSRRAALVPVRAFVDPGSDGVDLRGRQCLAFHRHRRLVESRHGAVEPAPIGAAGNDGRTAVPAFERGGATTKVEPGQLDGFSVTVPAAPRHDRSDVSRERDARPRLRTGEGACARDECG